jgi:Na+/proline symporter
VTVLDWIVFAAFLVWVVQDGVRRGKDSKDLEGYFAGNRRIPWWAAGLSVMATQASAITVIGTTGQGHETGLEFVQFYFGLPFALVLICALLVPSVPRQSDPDRIRVLGATLRARDARRSKHGVPARPLLRVRRRALCAERDAREMLGVPISATILTVGALTTLYTVFGGVSAVIYTDVKQMAVILGGLVVCFGVVLWRLLGEVDVVQGSSCSGPRASSRPSRPCPDSLDFVPALRVEDGDPPPPRTFWDDKYNLWSGLIGGLFLQLAYFGCDQSQVQRILTNPTANESRKALLLSAIAKVPMQAVILLLGALIWLFHVYDDARLINGTAQQEIAVRAAAADPVFAARYRNIEVRHAEAVAERLAAARAFTELGDDAAKDERDASLRAFRERAAAERAIRREVFRAMEEAELVPANSGDTNRIFPQFILDNLPPVLLGLVIAAIFAAAMSSADSALNSLTAATIVDFYKRWLRPHASERENLRAAKLLSLLWGTFATLFALQVSGASSVIELVNEIGSYFYGTLLGTFALALFFPRVGRWASFIGLLAGMATVLVVDRTIRIEYLWYNVIGTVAVVLVGGLLSIVMPRDRS